MLEPEQLNPVDVLNHLKDLGFQNVSKQQLEDFIHDLKKLIKYERDRSRKRFQLSRTCDRIDHSECDCHSTDSNTNDERSISDESQCTSQASDSSLNTCKTCDDKSDFVKSSARSNSQKLPSSFIRPWNLPSSTDNSFKNRQNLDPVRLYHHYKKIWKNNKIPGESNHSQLRWMIRNKMMGQEPQPRVMIPSNTNFK